MAITLRFKNLDKVANSIGQGATTKPVIRIGLSVSGKAAAYATVWEYGRVNCKPGPKTVYSTNFQGQNVVLTKTAPLGFIRVNNQKYREFVRQEIKAVDWKKVKFSAIADVILKALARAASKCADLISVTAPIDTGELRAAIRNADLSEVGQPTTYEQVSIRTRLSKGKK